MENEQLNGVIAVCPYARLYREAFDKEMAGMGFDPASARLLELKPEEWGNGKKTELLKEGIRRDQRRGARWFPRALSSRRPW